MSQVFRWEKLGNVFNPTALETPYWMNEFAQAPHVVPFDDFIRVYFSCRPAPDEYGQYVSYSAFVDFNKTDLFKPVRISEEPILKLGDLGTFDEFGTYPVSVIKNGNEFWAYYAGWTRCESVPFNTAIGFAKSNNNGVTFDKAGNGPILSYSADEPFILSGPKVRKFGDKWYLFYIAGREWILDNNKPEPVYKIRLAISGDGINWEKQNTDLIKSTIENEAQASPDVFYKEGLYHMFYCYRGGKDYRSKNNGYRIGYAYSKNLIDWIRADHLVGIDVSETGWDSEMISYPHVFELEGETYMYYLGNAVGKSGFGLAILKK
ncbi:MAG: hypothetical protein ABIX01_13245 [Chitinophagaceae bacterium]